MTVIGEEEIHIEVTVGDVIILEAEMENEAAIGGKVIKERETKSTKKTSIGEKKAMAQIVLAEIMTMPSTGRGFGERNTNVLAPMTTITVRLLGIVGDIDVVTIMSKVR